MGRLGARVFSLGAVSAAAFSLQVAAARAEPRLRDVGPVSTDPAADASQVIRERTWRWRVEVPAQPSDHLVAALGRRLFVLSRTTLKTVRLPAALHTPSATEPVR
jgi:hypothetical protein